MDFKLSEFSNSVMQPIGDPDIEKIVVGGEEMRAYVFKDKILMSPGTWNGWYYSPDEIQKAYNNTDWTDASNLALFADHKDRDTSAWIGYVRNPKLQSGHQVGDLVLCDKEYAKKLMLGAKFGVSPKLSGMGRDGAVSNASYKNFSVVVEPACKTTFLNEEEKIEIKQVEELQEKPMKPEKGPCQKCKQEPCVCEDEDEESIENASNNKMEPKIEAKVEEKLTETKVEQPVVVDRSAELIAKLSSSISEGFATVSKRMDEMAKPVEAPAPALPEGEPIRQSLKESEVVSEATVSYSNADSGMMSWLKQLGKGSESFELSMEEDTKSGLPWMTFTLASTATAVSSVRGTSRTAYNLLPTAWANAIVDGGKNSLFFTNVVRQATVPEGTNDYIMPIRKKYEDSWETSAEEYAIDTNVLATVLNDMDGVQFTPVRYNYRVAVTNKAINTNQIDLMRYAREELAYKWANDVDAAVAAALIAGTAAANDTPGTIPIYGGDAYTVATLTAGDTLTTDLIAKGKRLLRTKYNYYWNTSTFTKDNVLKNPWENTPDSPYVLFIAPEQEEVLLTDSQFVNAAEYGDNEVVLNGEIGKYLGVKVVVSNNTPAYANFGAGTNLDGHKCVLVKSQYCGGIAWGQKPKIQAFDWPIEDKKMISMSLDYVAKNLQPDAVVTLNVVDV